VLNPSLPKRVIGLINRICRSEELLDESIRLAETMASRPRRALLETKRLSRELIDMDTESAMKRMVDYRFPSLHLPTIPKMEQLVC